MNLKDPSDIASLPDGAVTIIKNGRETPVSFDMAWALEAAKAINGAAGCRQFRTKADIIEEAINNSHWGLGGHGYTARAIKYGSRGFDW